MVRMNSLTEQERASFSRIVEPYLARDEVRRMDDYIQHGNVTTLAHCLRVARTCYAWSVRLHLAVDEEDLVVGALLHDFYLYDWHDRSTSRPHHATMHPVYAAQNARDILDVSPRVQGIISSHMWPLPPDRPPRCREAALLCAADKWCSLEETIAMRRAPRRAATPGDPAAAADAGASRDGQGRASA